MTPRTVPSSSNLTLAAYLTPIGRLTLAARGGALVGLWAADQRFFGEPFGIDEAVAARADDLTQSAGRAALLARVPTGDAKALKAAASWLDDYVEGLAPSPSRLPITPLGSKFQLLVWQTMDAIPYGATRTYGQIAARLTSAGTPASAQAVGGAVGRNPLLLIRPCHRVVAASSPGGYAAGAEAKAWLLAHEAATV